MVSQGTRSSLHLRLYEIHYLYVVGAHKHLCIFLIQKHILNLEKFHFSDGTIDFHR